MRKLGLKVEDLSVETFAVAEEPAARGTVVAHETGGQRLCTEGFGTCDYSCGVGGCGGSADCTLGCNDTYDYTCATGDQRICMCGG
jgi:hypothetical protein